jgi:hypothetical protein
VAADSLLVSKLESPNTLRACGSPQIIRSRLGSLRASYFRVKPIANRADIDAHIRFGTKSDNVTSAMERTTVSKGIWLKDSTSQKIVVAFGVGRDKSRKLLSSERFSRTLRWIQP